MRIRVPNKNKIMRWVVAFLIVIILFGIRLPQKKTQYDIVVLGDSVVGNAASFETSVTEYMEESLQKSVFKGAFGGSCLSCDSKMLYGSNVSYEWSMAKLAEAIAYDDWASQNAAMAQALKYQPINNQTPSYFESTMEVLQTIDFDKVEVLIIEHGTNDYNAGRIVDNPNNPYDITTFGGALRHSIRLLKDKYPKLRIVVVSPIYCALGANLENACDSTKYGEGGCIGEYIAVEQQIAKEMQVEWIDAYHEIGIHAENIETYLSDGLHLNEAGRELYGNFLADYFKNGTGEE